jgi:hypothetical protein
MGDRVKAEFFVLVHGWWPAAGGVCRVAARFPLAVELFIVETDPTSIEAAIASAAADGAQALVGASDGTIVARRHLARDEPIQFKALRQAP